MKFTVGVLCASVAWADLVVEFTGSCVKDDEACSGLQGAVNESAADVTNYPTILAAANACLAKAGDACGITITGTVAIGEALNCEGQAGYSIPDNALANWTVDKKIGVTGDFTGCAPTDAHYIEESAAGFCAAPADGKSTKITVGDKIITLEAGNPIGGLVIDGCESVTTNEFTLTLETKLEAEGSNEGSSTFSEGEGDSPSEDSEDSEASVSSESSEGSATGGEKTTTPGKSPAAAEGLLAASLVTSVIVVLGNL